MLGACSYGLIGITIGSCSRCLPLAVALSVYLGLLLLLSPPFLIAPCHLALRYPSGSIDFDFFYNRRVKQNTLFELCCWNQFYRSGFPFLSNRLECHCWLAFKGWLKSGSPLALITSPFFILPGQSFVGYPSGAIDFEHASKTKFK